jgi:hypothetical protein
LGAGREYHGTWRILSRRNLAVGRGGFCEAALST